jgi:hypothetical protein
MAARAAAFVTVLEEMAEEGRARMSANTNAPVPDRPATMRRVSPSTIGERGRSHVL